MAPGSWPAGPTWSSAPGRARRRCPRASSRSTGSTSCAGSTADEDADTRRARHTRRDRRQPGDPRTADRARRRQRDRRLARDPRGRDDRRQPDERVAGDGDRRTAAVLRRAVTLRSATGTRELVIDELLDGPGRTTASPTSFWKRSAFRSRRPGLAAATCGSSTAARWRSRSSARPPWSRSKAAA